MMETLSFHLFWFKPDNLRKLFGLTDVSCAQFISCSRPNGGRTEIRRLEYTLLIPELFGELATSCCVQCLSSTLAGKVRVSPELLAKFSYFLFPF